MDYSTTTTTYGGTPGPRRVRVPNREDVGIVVNPGMNIGIPQSIYCLGIYFPETGECLYYEAKRVQDADE